MTQEKSIDNNLIFTGTCQAGTGVVAAVTGFLASRNCYICALEQFDDESTDKFFMRAVFRPQKDSPAVEKITEDFAVIAESFDMEWKFHRPGCSKNHNSSLKVRSLSRRFTLPAA